MISLGATTSTSAVMSCSAQKSSISRTSRVPPAPELARLRRLAAIVKGLTSKWSGMPTEQIVPSSFSVSITGGHRVDGGDGVEEEVEAAAMGRHLLLVGGDDDLVGAEREDRVALVGGGGEGDDVGAERVGELHPEVAEAADPDHADLAAGADLPVAQRRPGGHPGAEERRGAGQVEARRAARWTKRWWATSESA